MSYKEIYATKPIGYFSFFRYDIIKLINCNNCNILEIRCGQGNTLIELKKQGKAKFITGIDIVDLNQLTRLDKFILAILKVKKILICQKTILISLYVPMFWNI